MRLMKNALTACATLALAATIPLASPVSAQAPGEISAVPNPSCDRECLIDMLGTHMEALKARDASALPLARNVVFTENNVQIPLGQGLWRTIEAYEETGLETADPSTGNAAWFGAVTENGEPAFYAMRLHVTDGLIDEIETVVHRKTALPAPFGDWENQVHFKEFYEVLPEEERRPRKRMRAIADSYFDTVELNDGVVFAPFADDCSRLENGISTTAASPEGGNAASIMAGCENQFKLGLYKINKRIRRDIFIIDEERGVAVARGFFDHANEFDRYNLTDGREMRTALQWPNTISLIEAFRIRNGAIQRIEATFTYVPYFMNNQFWGEGAKFPEYAANPAACDAACLTANSASLVSGMVDNKWQGLNWADTVGYSENSVGIRVGEGIWATVTAIDDNPLIVSDELTGKSVWIGRIEEHGQPAWAAITTTAAGDKIGSVDAVIRRSEYGPPYAEPTKSLEYSTFTESVSTSRDDMIAGAASFFTALEANGPAPEALSDGCHWLVNGQDMGECGPTFGGSALANIETVRDRKLLAIDESRGLAVYRAFEDLPSAAGSGYPLTYQVVVMLRFDHGEITQIQAFTSELPYGMQPR